MFVQDGLSKQHEIAVNSTDINMVYYGLFKTEITLLQVPGT